MAEERTKHRVAHVFEVEIDRTDDEEDRERRYQAWCSELSGCRVYASSKAKALRKIRLAIKLWLDLADRQFNDDPEGVAERLDMMIPD